MRTSPVRIGVDRTRLRRACRRARVRGDRGLRGRRRRVAARRRRRARRCCARADVDLVAVHSPPFLHRDARAARARRRARPCCATSRSVATPTTRPRCTTTRAPRASLHLAATSSSATSPGASRSARCELDGAVGTVEHVQWNAVQRRLPRPAAPLRLAVRRASAAAAGSARGDRTRSTSLRWTFGELVRLRSRAAHRRSTNGPTPTAPCTSAPPRTVHRVAAHRRRRDAHHRHAVRRAGEPAEPHHRHRVRRRARARRRSPHHVAHTATGVDELFALDVTRRRSAPAPDAALGRGGARCRPQPAPRRPMPRPSPTAWPAREVMDSAQRRSREAEGRLPAGHRRVDARRAPRSASARAAAASGRPSAAKAWARATRQMCLLECRFAGVHAGDDPVEPAGDVVGTATQREEGVGELELELVEVGAVDAGRDRRRSASSRSSGGRPVRARAHCGSAAPGPMPQLGHPRPRRRRARPSLLAVRPAWSNARAEAHSPLEVERRGDFRCGVRWRATGSASAAPAATSTWSASCGRSDRAGPGRGRFRRSARRPRPMPPTTRPAAASARIWTAEAWPVPHGSLSSTHRVDGRARRSTAVPARPDHNAMLPSSICRIAVTHRLPMVSLSGSCSSASCSASSRRPCMNRTQASTANVQLRPP